MEIVDEVTHRTLAYIETVNRQGVKPTAAQVNAFADRPGPKESTAISRLGALSANLDRMVGYYKEPHQRYLSRLGWAVERDDGVELTRLGRALLKGLNSPSLDVAADMVEIALDPDNPFAYAQALDALGSRGPSMLVEPYFRLEQLTSIADLDNIERVLLGKQTGKQDRAVLAVGLAAVPEENRPGLRFVDDLHDRYLIPVGEESALMLGASLGDIGKKVSTLTTLGTLASSALRDAHDLLWDRATTIDPASPTGGSVPGDHQERAGGRA